MRVEPQVDRREATPVNSPSVITNEPSTHQTPLPTEPTGLPEQRPNEEIQTPSMPLHSLRWLPWFKLFMAFLVWFVSVLLLVFVPLIVASPYLIHKWMTVGLPPPEALTSDKTLIFLSIIGLIPTHLITLGFIWLIVTERRQQPFWKTVGFEWPKTVSPAVGTLVCVSLAILLLLIGWGVTALWGGEKTQIDLLVESSLAARLATAFVATATAPLVEEIVYRGVLYSAIQRALGMGVAIGAVSLLFAGVHVFQYANNIGVITVITLLSFTLTAARAYTGKVLPSFIIHFVFNGIQSLLIILAPLAGSGGSS